MKLAKSLWLGIWLGAMGCAGSAWAASDELVAGQAALLTNPHAQAFWPVDDLWMGLVGAGLVLLARLARSGRLGRWATDI
jgi:hypothetical protein